MERNNNSGLYHLLTTFQRGMAHVPVDIPVYFNYGVFNNKHEAVKKSHISDLEYYPDFPFDDWLKETQGDESYHEFIKYQEEYDKQYYEALNNFNKVIPEEEIPIKILEFSSPTEIYDVSIIIAGYWTDIKDKLVSFLKEEYENEKLESFLDLWQKNPEILEEDVVSDFINEFVEWHNENANY